MVVFHVSTFILQLHQPRGFLYTKSPENQWFSGLGGGDKRDRTADLLNAMASGGGQNEYIWIKWTK